MSNLDDAFILDLRIQFCHDALESIQEVESILLDIEKAKAPVRTEELKRHLHSLKGNARAVGFEKLSGIAHNIESMCVETSLASKVDELLKTCDKMVASVKAFLSTRDTVGLV